jgi:hypothetical protein
VACYRKVIRIIHYRRGEKRMNENLQGIIRILAEIAVEQYLEELAEEQKNLTQDSGE